MVVTECRHGRPSSSSSCVAPAHDAHPTLEFDTPRLIPVVVSQSRCRGFIRFFSRLLRDLLSGKNLVYLLIFALMHLRGSTAELRAPALVSNSLKFGYFSPGAMVLRAGGSLYLYIRDAVVPEIAPGFSPVGKS